MPLRRQSFCLRIISQGHAALSNSHIKQFVISFKDSFLSPCLCRLNIPFFLVLMTTSIGIPCMSLISWQRGLHLSYTPLWLEQAALKLYHSLENINHMLQYSFKILVKFGERQGTPWASCHSIAGQTHRSRQTFTAMGNLRWLVDPICKFLDCGRKPEYHKETYTGTGKTCNIFGCIAHFSGIKWCYLRTIIRTQ